MVLTSWTQRSAQGILLLEVPTCGLGLFVRFRGLGMAEVRIGSFVWFGLGDGDGGARQCMAKDSTERDRGTTHACMHAYIHTNTNLAREEDEDDHHRRPHRQRRLRRRAEGADGEACRWVGRTNMGYTGIRWMVSHGRVTPHAKMCRPDRYKAPNHAPHVLFPYQGRRP